MRREIDRWRLLPQDKWGVTPPPAHLLTHWRHYYFPGVRPFFCQLEAVETEARADRCHVNWAICDSAWEVEFRRVLESHPRVIAYEIEADLRAFVEARLAEVVAEHATGQAAA